MVTTVPRSVFSVVVVAAVAAVAGRRADGDEGRAEPGSRGGPSWPSASACSPAHLE
jgi:hypothetical protein